MRHVLNGKLPVTTQSFLNVWCLPGVGDAPPPKGQLLPGNPLTWLPASICAGFALRDALMVGVGMEPGFLIKPIRAMDHYAIDYHLVTACERAINPDGSVGDVLKSNGVSSPDSGKAKLAMLFSRFDSLQGPERGMAKLDLAELTRLLESIPSIGAKAADVLKKYDTDGDGALSLQEFTFAMVSLG